MSLISEFHFITLFNTRSRSVLYSQIYTQFDAAHHEPHARLMHYRKEEDILSMLQRASYNTQKFYRQQ